MDKLKVWDLLQTDLPLQGNLHSVHLKCFLKPPTTATSIGCIFTSVAFVWFPSPCFQGNFKMNCISSTDQLIFSNKSNAHLYEKHDNFASLNAGGQTSVMGTKFTANRTSSKASMILVQLSHFNRFLLWSNLEGW